MVLFLFHLLCNHDNLKINYIRKTSHLDEEWLFVGRFEVGSVPGIINKELLAQFIVKRA